jgi:hypothetical protein
MTREEKIGWVSRWLVAGMALALCYHGTMSLLGAGYPYDTFLFRPEDRFNDFWNPMRLAHDPYIKPIEIGNYFPLNYVALNLLRPLGTPWSLLFFTFSFLITFCVLCWFQLRGAFWYQSASRVVILTSCSYPIWFSLDRANLEIWAFGSTALWAYLYQRERSRAANFALALTLNLKPFPIVFWGLYAARGKWKDLLQCAMASAATFVFFMALLPGTVPDNIRRLMGNLNLYNKVYIEGSEGMPFAHSLFGVLKMAVGAAAPGGPLAYNADVLMRPYLALSLVVMVGLSFYLARVTLPWWAQMALLVSAMNLLPFFSADYKLLHIFLPLFAWINITSAEALPQAPTHQASRSDSVQSDKITGALFALLLTPKNIGHPWGDEISLGSILNPLLLVALCVMAARVRSSFIGEARG